jgi:hypothetical protein
MNTEKFKEKNLELIYFIKDPGCEVNMQTPILFL